MENILNRVCKRAMAVPKVISAPPRIQHQWFVRLAHIQHPAQLLVLHVMLANSARILVMQLKFRTAQLVTIQLQVQHCV